MGLGNAMMDTSRVRSGNAVDAGRRAGSGDGGGWAAMNQRDDDGAVPGGGAPDDLEATLDGDPGPSARPGLGSSAGSRPGPSADRACQELIERWRRGDRVPVEALWSGWPGGPPRGDDLFELVYTEYLLRDEAGEPALNDLAARFPALADRLRHQAALHRALLGPGGDSIDPTQGATRASPGGATLPGPTGPGPPVSTGRTTWRGPAGYEIKRLLGRGGMGVVYEARQVRLNRPVALKMIRSGVHASPEDRLRFISEAEVIARLRHPNIVQVYAFGDSDGQPFFEMEYVDGGSLIDRLDGTPRPTRDASALLEILARAIHEAHRKGVIHRDLKPSNILLMADGSPKIVDFGLAKLIGSEGGLTRTDSVLGSPAYMAPEQAAGRASAVAPASDVYALGAIYYEMLTGRQPFVAGTTMETLDLVRHAEPVAPSRLRPGLPLDLETICLRCLNKDPGRRYASAEALADDLGRWLRGESILARPTGLLERGYRWSLRNRAVAGLLASIGLLLVGGTTGMAILWARARSEAANALSHARKADETNVELGRISAGLTLDRGIALAADGEVARGLSYMARAAQLDGGRESPIGRAARANLAAWSRLVPRPVAEVAITVPVASARIAPDRRTAALAGLDGSIDFRDLETPARLVSTGPLPGGPAEAMDYRPDGLALATLRRTTGLVEVRDPATGRALGPPIHRASGEGQVRLHPGSSIVAWRAGRTLALHEIATGRPIGEPIAADSTIRDMVFSPDGSTLIAVTESGQIIAVDGRTGRPRGKPPVVKTAWVVVFHPDGSRFAVGFGPYSLSKAERRDGSGAQAFETATLRPVGPRMPHEVGVVELSYRADGRVLVSGDFGGTTRIWDAEGRPIGTPLKGDGSVDGLKFSPDGSLLMTRSNQGSVRIGEVATGLQVGSTLEMAGASRADFSADGRRAILIGRSTIRALDLTGAAMPARSALRETTLIRFRPDGASLLAGGYDGVGRLLSTRTMRPIGWPMPHQGNIQVAALSPDGARIATGSRDGTVRVWDAEGRSVLPPIALRHWASALCFSPDSRRLLVADESGDVSLIDLATGRRLGEPQHHDGTKFPGASVKNLLFSPDGRVGLAVGNSTSFGRIDGITGRSLGPVLDLGGKGQLVGLSGDGLTLAIVIDGSIRRFDATTGAERLPPLGREIRTAAAMPDGRTIVGGGTDRIVRFWDFAAGRPVGVPIETTHPIFRLQPDAEGRTLILSSDSGQARRWDIASGRPIGPSLPFDPVFAPPAFSPAGRSFALTDETTRLYPIDLPESVPASALPDRVAALTGMAIDDRGGIAPTVEPALPLAADPDRPDDWHERASAELSGRRDHPAALWHRSRLAAARPDDWEAHALLSETLEALGRSADAGAEARRARSLAGPVEAARWDAFRAFDLFRDGRQVEGIDHLGRALAAYPPNAAMYHDLRARLELNRKDWAAAAGDYAAGTWRDYADPGDFQRAMLVALLARDARFYRQIGEHLLRPKLDLPPARSGETSAKVRFACYGPGALADPEALARLAEAGDREGAAETSPLFPLAHGMALYRAGRFERAIARLTSTVAGGASVADSLDARAFLAMAHGRLGRGPEARRYLGLLPREASTTVDIPELIRLALVREADEVVLDAGFPADPFGPKG